MNLKRVWTLIKAEVLHGPKDIMLVMAVVLPILLALFVNLAFGNIFTDRAKLGVFDQGQSQVVSLLRDAESITYKDYDSEAALKTAAANGAVDMGVVLPADFDAVLEGGAIRLKAYIWGESLAKNRAVIPVVLADAVRTVTGSSLPVDVRAIALGDEVSMPWSDRLLPLVVLMAVFYGGMMLPPSSLISEKQHRTLEALNVTPATIGDIFLAKGIIGMALATVMGVLTLVLSGAFGGSAPALILVLWLGAVMAAEIGLIAGALINDMNSLYAVTKAGGIFLFAPAIVFMFPQIPSWLGYVFPTYYVVRPVVDLSVSGKSFGDEAVYVVVLTGLVVLGGVAVMAIVRRLSAHALRLNG